jgi:putative transcriptional regulator
VNRKKNKSDISDALHSAASALHKVGALDKMTMRDFDARHLEVPPEIAPEETERHDTQTTDG